MWSYSPQKKSVEIQYKFYALLYYLKQIHRSKTWTGITPSVVRKNLLLWVQYTVTPASHASTRETICEATCSSTADWLIQITSFFQQHIVLSFYSINNYVFYSQLTSDTSRFNYDIVILMKQILKFEKLMNGYGINYKYMVHHDY